MPSEGPFQIAQRSNSISRWSGQVVTVTKLAVKFLNRAKLPEPAIPLRVHTVRHTAARVPVCHAPGDLEPLRARDRGNCRRCCRESPRRRRELIPGGGGPSISSSQVAGPGRPVAGPPPRFPSREFQNRERSSTRIRAAKRAQDRPRAEASVPPGRRVRRSGSELRSRDPSGCRGCPARLAGAVMRIRNLRYCSSRRRRRSGQGSIRAAGFSAGGPTTSSGSESGPRGQPSQSGPGQSCTEDGQTCQGQRDCAATFGHESDGPLSDSGLLPGTHSAARQDQIEIHPDHRRIQ